MTVAGQQAETVAALFTTTGFWDVVREDPFSRSQWLEAVRVAPSIKSDFFTVLSTCDCLPEIVAMLDEDPALHGCFN